MFWNLNEIVKDSKSCACTKNICTKTFEYWNEFVQLLVLKSVCTLFVLKSVGVKNVGAEKCFYLKNDVTVFVS